MVVTGMLLHTSGPNVSLTTWLFPGWHHSQMRKRPEGEHGAP